MKKIYQIVLHSLLIFAAFEIFSVTREYDKLHKLLSREAPQPLAPGDLIPALHGKNVATGEEITFTGKTNKPTLMSFYTTWCPHCQVTLPKWNELSKYAKAHGCGMIAIAADDKEKVKRFSDSLHLSFKSYVVDSVQQTLTSFKVSGFPVTYLIDTNGKVLKAHSGELTNEIIEEFKKFLQ